MTKEELQAMGFKDFELSSEFLESLCIMKDSEGEIAFLYKGLHLHLDNPFLRQGLVSSKAMLSKFKDIDEMLSNKGSRLELHKGIPNSAARNKGRLYFNEADNKIYCDMGVKLKRVSSDKFEMDVRVSNPSEPILINLKNSGIVDAQRCLWQVIDNSHDFLRVNAKVTSPHPYELKVELPMGCAEGTYRILGVE